MGSDGRAVSTLVPAESGGLLKPVQRGHLITVPQWGFSDFQCDGNHMLEE